MTPALTNTRIIAAQPYFRTRRIRRSAGDSLSGMSSGGGGAFHVSVATGRSGTGRGRTKSASGKAGSWSTGSGRSPAPDSNRRVGPAVAASRWTVETSRSASSRNSCTSRRRSPHELHAATWALISATSFGSSSPSSLACSVPSSRCDILPPLLLSGAFLGPVGFHQPSARARQRRPDRPFGEAERGGNLLVIEPFCSQQQRLAVPFVQGGQRRADSGRLLPALHLQVRRVGGLALLGLEQLQPPTPGHRTAAVLAHQVERDGEQPGTRVVRRGCHRPGERFLGEVFRAVAIPRPAVEHSDQRGVVLLKELREVGRHDSGT